MLLAPRVVGTEHAEPINQQGVTALLNRTTRPPTAVWRGEKSRAGAHADPKAWRSQTGKVGCGSEAQHHTAAMRGRRCGS